MRKAFEKDSKKMFRNNLGRFISIVLIIMLGVAFFVGMNSVSPAMEKVAEEHMKDNKVFDIALTSSLGYKKEDIEKLKENDNIIEIQGTYTYDALIDFDNKSLVVRLTSMKEDSNINQNDIYEGRNIKENDECLICSRLAEMYNYKIGDKIKVYRKDNVKLEDFIEYTEFEIVGITKNPMYLSKFYGNTTLLTGELSAYIVVKEEVFKLNEYTGIYIRTNVDEKINRFSDGYKESNEKIIDDIESINEEIAEQKLNELKKEYQKNFEKVEDSIQKAENLIKEGKTGVRKAQLELNEGIANISKYVSALYNANNLYKMALEKQNEISTKTKQLEILEKYEEDLLEEYNNLEIKNIELENNLESLEKTIEKNLYKLYSIEDKEQDFVKLNMENNKLYYKYNENNSEYEKIKKEYNNKKSKIDEVQSAISKMKEQIEEKQNDLYSLFDGMKILIANIGNTKLNNQAIMIEENKKEIIDKKQEVENQDSKEKIEKVKNELKEQKEKLNTIKVAELTTPLYESSGFKSLKDDLVKIGVMGKIFPVMFFIIAALVTMTTITRMIEEDRKNIGTLKALGYRKSIIVSRYIKYSLSAGLVGTVIGVLIGSTAIVWVLYVSYSSLYDLPSFKTNINIEYTLMSLAISLISTVLVATIVTLKELKENTAQLMRPKNTATGKTILLEKIPFIWRKLDFLFKICFRNIFRYKRRLLMTLIGIAGCTALIYAGLSLQSAINGIGEKEFKVVRKMSMEIFLQGDIKAEDISEIENYVKEQKDVKEVTSVSQKSLTVSANDNSKDVFYIAISSDDAENYIGLKNRKTKEEVKLNDDGVILTEKLANILEVEKGDKIEILTENTKNIVTVTGITENYLYNFVYFTPNMYERIFEKEIEYNEIFVNTTEDLTEKQGIELSEKLTENDKIVSVALEKNTEKEFQTSLASLTSIVILFIGSASLLSIVVLVNLNNINIEERKRELATIKLLGFYKKELESYVFRENIILTLIGIILGLGLGMGILKVIIEAAEVETIFLAKEINVINLLISAVLTIGFTLITNLFMKKKIANINMIDSLKSIE